MVILSSLQLDKLSDVLINVGTVFFASLVVPFFIPSLDKPALQVLGLGLGVSMGMWLIAVKLVE